MPLAELRAEALIEEAAEEQHRSDREEREGARDRAQRGEVVEENLRQAYAEGGEAGQAQLPRVPRQPEIEDCQAERAPEGAHGRMAVLKLQMDASCPTPLEELEDRERDRGDPRDAGQPARG